MNKVTYFYKADCAEAFHTGIFVSLYGTRFLNFKTRSAPAAGRRTPGFLKCGSSVCVFVCTCVCMCVCLRARGY